MGSLLYIYASLNLGQSLSFTVCLSTVIHARLLLSGQLFLAVLRLTPESHLPSHPDGSQIKKWIHLKSNKVGICKFSIIYPDTVEKAQYLGSSQTKGQPLPPGLVSFLV